MRATQPNASFVVAVAVAVAADVHHIFFSCTFHENKMPEAFFKVQPLI